MIPSSRSYDSPVESPQTVCPPRWWTHLLALLLMVNLAVLGLQSYCHVQLAREYAVAQNHVREAQRLQRESQQHLDISRDLLDQARVYAPLKKLNWTHDDAAQVSQL